MLKMAMAILGLASVAALALIIDADSSPAGRREYAETPSLCIVAPGRVEGASEEIELRPELPDRIVEVLVREGDCVTADAVLLRLAGSAQRHEFAMAEADLEIAAAELQRLENGARPQEIHVAQAELRALKARLSGALDRLRRTAKLRENGSTSESDFVNDTSEANALSAQVNAAEARLDLLQAPPREEDLRRARARVAGARARLELARKNLEKTSLKAPCAGQVLKLKAQVGELSGPDIAEAAVVLADTTTKVVHAFVEELDAPRMQVGLPAEVSADGLPDRQFQGWVTRVAPRMSRKRLWTDDPSEQFDSKVREVWIDVKEAAPLIVGLRVDARIALPDAVQARPEQRASQTNLGKRTHGVGF